MATQFALLTKKNFLPLFITQFLGAFNDNLFKNALVVLITYKLAEKYNLNIEFLTLLAAALFILPMVILSATAGQLADKYEKSNLISITKFAEIILMSIAAVAFYFESTAVLLTVLFFMGAQSTFFGPLKYSVLPEHLQTKELVSGNALIEAATFVSILLGTILGAVLIPVENGVIIISGLIIICAFAGWISSRHIPKTTNYNNKQEVNLNIFASTLKLCALVKDNKVIFRCILGISWFWLVGATYVAQFPIYAKDVLHANPNVLALLLTVFSIGIGFGSLLCNKLLKGTIEATFVPLGGIGLAIFGIELYYASQNVVSSAGHELTTITNFISHLPNIHILFALFMVAVSGGIYIVPLYAILQHTAKEESRGQTIACNNLYNALFMVIAAITAMIMLHLQFSITEVFLSISILSTFVAFYICKLLPYATVQAVLRITLSFLYRVEIIGNENLHNNLSKCVIIANHTSLLDGILITAFYPGRLVIGINTDWTKKFWIRLLLIFVDFKPLDPTNPMAIKSMINTVKDNNHMLIFPEGRITVTGSLMKVYEGPGLIANKADAPILPIQISGAQHSKFSYLKGKIKTKWLPRITMTIFPPEPMNIDATVAARDKRKLIGDKLYELMVSMAFHSTNYRKTLFHSLIDAKTIHGKNYEILRDASKTKLSYRQLINKSLLISYPIKNTTTNSNIIGILMPNSCAACVLFFAIQISHKVAAVLNISAGIDSILSAINTGEIRHIYTSRKFIEISKLDGLVKEIEDNGINMHYLEDLKSKIGVGTLLKAKLKSYSPLMFAKKNTATDPAVLLFTSGSEGQPKGVLLSHSNIQANRYQLSSVIDFTHSDVVLNALPIFHSFGLTAGTLLPVLSGIKTFLYPSPLHYRIIPEVAYDINATIMFGTNTFLSGYARYAHAYDFYSVRYVFAGAEKLQEDSRNIWTDKFGVRIFEGYGTTEAAPAISTNSPMHNKKCTVGKLLPGIKYKLDAVEGIESGGRLKVSGPNIMLGYILADAPGKVQPPSDGWYDTGDIVDFDAEGFIQIQGRAKRFAKIAGEMVSLTAVEMLLHELWDNSQHAIINVPDTKKGEKLILYTTEEHADISSIAKFVKNKGLSELMIPKIIHYQKQLPLLGSGKIDYAKLTNYNEAVKA